MKATFSARVALLAATILWAGFWSPRVARAASIYVPFNGEKTTWHDGFERYDYLLDEASFAITPFKRPDSEKFAVGSPPKGQRQCIVIPPLTAQSGAVRTQWNAAYQLMTEHGLSIQPVIEGTGTAAGEAYAWGDRKRGQGRLHRWPKSRPAQPRVQNLAVGKSRSARQSRRAAPARVRPDRPVVQPSNEGG